MATNTDEPIRFWTLNDLARELHVSPNLVSALHTTGHLVEDFKVGCALAFSPDRMSEYQAAIKKPFGLARAQSANAAAQKAKPTRNR
jgi:hypothetical protein